MNDITEGFFVEPIPARLARLRFGLLTFKASSTREAAALHAAVDGIGNEIPPAVAVISTSTSSAERSALSEEERDVRFQRFGKFFATGTPQEECDFENRFTRITFLTEDFKMESLDLTFNDELLELLSLFNTFILGLESSPGEVEPSFISEEKKVVQVKFKISNSNLKKTPHYKQYKLSPLKVIALFCGIPAAGKSRFVQSLFRILNESHESSGSVACVTFDEFLIKSPDSLKDALSTSEFGHASTEDDEIDNDDNDDNIEEVLEESIDNIHQREHRKDQSSNNIMWHESRRAALNRLESLVNDDDAVRYILVDDNFWLRSMRREVYRLARDARSPIKASFITFLVTVDVEEAILRDALRPERLSSLSFNSDIPSNMSTIRLQNPETYVDSYRVGETTIRKMANSFQSPLESRPSFTKKGDSYWDLRHCFKTPINSDTQANVIADVLLSTVNGANLAYIPRQPQLTRSSLAPSDAPLDAVTGEERPPPPRLPSEQMTLPGIISNAKERAELILRSLVAGKMQSMTDLDVNCLNRSRLGKMLAVAKKDVAEEVKQGLLRIQVTQTELREAEEAVQVILEGVSSLFESKVRFE